MTRRTKPRKTPPPPTIVPSGDVGRFRVQWPSGEYSEPVGLSEARELARVDELNKRGRVAHKLEH